MLFQHTWEKVLSGEKTQTRRIVKPEQEYAGALPHFIPYVYVNVGICGVRKVYEVNHTYAVQPGRNQKAIARIRITSIRREDVRNITEEDVKAEGFTSEVGFFMTWCRMHDKSLPLPIIPDYDTGAINWYGMKDDLVARPAERYDAWALTFEVVK